MHCSRLYGGWQVWRVWRGFMAAFFLVYSLALFLSPCVTAGCDFLLCRDGGRSKGPPPYQWPVFLSPVPGYLFVSACSFSLASLGMCKEGRDSASELAFSHPSLGTSCVHTLSPRNLPVVSSYMACLAVPSVPPTACRLLPACAYVRLYVDCCCLSVCLSVWYTVRTSKYSCYVHEER